MKSLLVKLGVILFLLVLLSGCASGHWYKPNMTDEELKRDSYQCEKDTIWTGYSWVRAKPFFRRCMESKGYEWVKD
jgi:hypothetical protein